MTWVQISRVGLCAHTGVCVLGWGDRRAPCCANSLARIGKAWVPVQALSMTYGAAVGLPIKTKVC